MTSKNRAPKARRTKAQPPLTLEHDEIPTRLRRTLRAAAIDAEQLRALGVGLGEAFDGMAAKDAPESLQEAATRIRALGGAALSTAARLLVEAERVETLAEIEAAGS